MPAVCVKEFALHVRSISLQAYWAFEQAAQPWLDSTGNNHPLVNTSFFPATSTAGKIALGAELKSGTTLSRFSNDINLVRSNGEFTLVGWGRIDTSLLAASLLNVFMLNAVTVQLQRASLIASGGNFALDLAGELTEVVNTTVPWVLGQTYFLAMWFDRGTNKFNVQIDNGAVFSSSGTWTPSASIASSRVAFSGPFATGLAYGMVDEAGLWNGALTTAQRSSLYNGGAGKTWPNVDVT